MIQHVHGWGQIPGVDSHRLVHPGGTKVATLLYRERNRPLLKLGALIDRWSRHPRFTEPRLGHPDAFATAEGEHAVTVSIAGVVDGKPAQQDLGFVFGDDFYALVHGICFVEAEFTRLRTLVRGLVFHDEHVLGVRRRRYLYTPPPRWQGLANGFQTDWYPTDYPANPTSISVLPATPTEVPTAELFAARIQQDVSRGFGLESASGPRELSLPNGLTGLCYAAVGLSPYGRRFFRKMTIFRAGRYVYPLFVDTAAADEERGEIERVFDDVCASVQAVPQATIGSTPSQALSHWLG
jgi:hypothetical protein